MTRDYSLSILEAALLLVIFYNLYLFLRGPIQ